MSEAAVRPGWVALDALEAEDAGEAVGGPFELRVDVAANLRLAGELPDAQDALGPVGLHVGSAEEAVACEQRQDVVPVDPLVLALVHLDQVLKAEQPLQQRPVPDEVVER